MSKTRRTGVPKSRFSASVALRLYVAGSKRSTQSSIPRACSRSRMWRRAASTRSSTSSPACCARLRSPSSKIVSSRSTTEGARPCAGRCPLDQCSPRPRSPPSRPRCPAWCCRCARPRAARMPCRASAPRAAAPDGSSGRTGCCRARAGNRYAGRTDIADGAAGHGLRRASDVVADLDRAARRKVKTGEELRELAR